MCIDRRLSSYIYIYISAINLRSGESYRDSKMDQAVSCYASFLFLSLLLCEICLVVG